MDLKGLGKKQKRILNEMARQKLVIRAYFELYEGREIVLEDYSKENQYEYLSGEFLNSLHKRRLLHGSCFLPSMRMKVLTFTLKTAVREYFLNEGKSSE